jgi:3-hydroxyacyl-CoA dehydrogenase
MYQDEDLAKLNDVVIEFWAGHFELMDLIGIDTVVGAMKYFEETVSKDFSPGKVFTDLIESGNLGVKSGKVFYDWTSGEGPKIDPSKKAELANAEMVLALQLNEGCRLIEQGIVKGYKIIDLILHQNDKYNDLNINSYHHV